MIKLYRSDCLIKLKEIATSSVDLIIMDPPYLQRGGSGSGAFGGNNRQYYSELSPISNGIDKAVLDECIRVLKKVNLYVYCNKAQLLFYLSYFESLPKKTNFNLICWHKTNPIPATSNIYLRDTEYILFFREKGVPLYGSYSTKRTYFLSSVNRADKKLYNHPTVKPIDQLKTFIINSSKEGDLVLDPYMGTGTTGAACKELNRDFIGVEIDKAHFETAKRRISGKTLL